MIEYGRRTKSLPPPPHVVWYDLVAPRLAGTRAWLELRNEETAPVIIESAEPSLVVWSSLWPDRLDDQIHFEVSAQGVQTSLQFTLFARTEPPDIERIHQIRYRVNRLLWNDLRLSYGA